MSLRYVYFNIDDKKQSRITIQLWQDEQLLGAIFLRRDSNLPDDPDPHTPCWQVAGIDVLEQFRRQGYGTKLYEEAARQAQKQGLTLCSDTVGDMATPALAFWEKQVQHRRAYWEVPGPPEREGHNYDYGRFVLKTPLPPTLSGAGEQKYDLPARVKARQGEKVNAKDYREIFEISEQWGEVAHWKDWDWYLLRDVPISELEYSTLEEYEAAAETDPEEEAWENIDRVNEIIRILQAGEVRWPVILDRDCGVLDGYHRISASNELGMKTIDVLYPVRKKPSV